MKKVLLGLLAMSAVSMAAVTDVTKPAVGGTDVFQTGQEGVIPVVGKLTSTVPVVKYVVFASEDNGVTMLDTLNLKDFIMSSEASVDGGFVAENPKVFVKRLNGNTVEELKDTDNVQFNFIAGKLAAELNGYTNNEFILDPGVTSTPRSVALWAESTKTDLEGLGYRYDGKYGNLIDADGNMWRSNSRLLLSHTQNGTFELKSVVTGDEKTNSDAKFSKLLQYFAGGKSIDPAIKLKVTVH